MSDNAAMFEALKMVNSWLSSVAECDMDEIVADGGITAAMVVRQEAAHQQRKVRAAIAQAIAARTPPAATDRAPAITGQNGVHEAQPPGAGEHGRSAPRRGETHGEAEGSTP